MEEFQCGECLRCGHGEDEGEDDAMAVSPCSASEHLSVYDVATVRTRMRMAPWQSHLVLLQSICKGLRTCSTDPIAVEVQCGECLRCDWGEDKGEDGPMSVSPCSASEHLQGTAHLQHRSNRRRGSVW